MELGSESGKIVAQAIQNAVNNAINEMSENIPCNKIKYGIVESVDNKKFTLIIDNAKYTNVRAIFPMTNSITKNDMVICVIPNNQMSNMFILGKLDE